MSWVGRNEEGGDDSLPCVADNYAVRVEHGHYLEDEQVPAQCTTTSLVNKHNQRKFYCV